MDWLDWLLLAARIVLVFFGLLISVLLYIWFERKVIADLQTRKGPMRAGPRGILVTLADGIKLFFKEGIVPTNADRRVYLLAPVLAMSSIAVYGVVLAGWASGSNYPLLGAVRSTAQMISYEVAMGLSLVAVLMYSGHLSFSEIVAAQDRVWNVVPMFPAFVVYLICGIAETNRPPFDLAEAETELVAGFQTEDSGITFAMFFLGEY